EEILKISEIAARNGIRHLKVTGGEPLARKGCADFIRELKQVPGIEHVTLTTNGVMLSAVLPILREAGIDGINISLDTLNRETYKRITGRDEFDRVWQGFQEAVKLGIKVKINCVPIAGYNESEYKMLAGLAAEYPVDVRFIEMMPIGYGREFGRVPGEKILDEILSVYPDLTQSEKKRGFGPAFYYAGESLKGSIGFIEALNHKFCSKCNRIRLTADGYLKTCLYYKNSINMKKAVREGASEEEISQLFQKAFENKPKEHHFGLIEDNSEQRKMSQIGG
ncbi:MAG: radical SAM protein, partial [Lachnospiraceae bacterium]|nr:radical SAM protein [Lachnospiraceae bacterium]